MRASGREDRTSNMSRYHAARIQRLSGSGTRFLWSFDRRLLSLSCLAIKTIGEETWNVGSSLTGGHKTENDSGVHGQPSTAAPSVFDASYLCHGRSVLTVSIILVS